MSHHSLTAYGRVALAGADVVVPVEESVGAAPERSEILRVVREHAAALCREHGSHRLVEVPTGPELLTALEACPVRLSTMGRGLDADPEAFVAAGAAGIHAAALSVD